MFNCNGGRLHKHIVAHVATWRVKMIRAIPLKYHVDHNGEWFKTLSDDAFQASYF